MAKGLTLSLIVVAMVLSASLYTATIDASQPNPLLGGEEGYRLELIELGDGVYILHHDVGAVDYLAYLGNDLILAVTASGTMIIDASSGEVKYILPRFPAETHVEYAVLKWPYLTLAGGEDVIHVYDLSSAGKNVYYNVNVVEDAGRFLGATNEYLLYYRNGRIVGRDPVNLSILWGLEAGGRPCCASGNNGYVVTLSDYPDLGEYRLLVWHNGGLLYNLSLIDDDYSGEDLAVSPDGMKAAIVFMDDDSRIFVVDLASGSVIDVFTDEKGVVNHVEWINDELLVAWSKLGARVFDLERGEVFSRTLVNTLYLGRGYLLLKVPGHDPPIYTLYRVGPAGVESLCNITSPVLEMGGANITLKAVAGVVSDDSVYIFYKKNLGEGYYVMDIASYGMNCSMRRHDPVYRRLASTHVYDDYVVLVFRNPGIGDLSSVTIVAMKNGEVVGAVDVDQTVEPLYDVLCVDDDVVVVYNKSIPNAHEIDLVNITSGEIVYRHEAASNPGPICFRSGNSMILAYTYGSRLNASIVVIGEDISTHDISLGSNVKGYTIAEDGSIYVYSSDRVVEYSPGTGVVRELSIDPLSDYAGFSSYSFIEHVVVSDDKLYIEVRDPEEGDEFYALLLDRSTMEPIASIGLGRYPGETLFQGLPIVIDGYVLTRGWDSYHILSLEDLSVVWSPSNVLAACSRSGFVYTINYTGNQAVLEAHYPSGTPAYTVSLPVESGHVTHGACYGRFIAFESSGYLIVHDVVTEETWAVYVHWTPQLSSSGDASVLALTQPYGYTLLLGEPVSETITPSPGNTTTEAVTTTTTESPGQTQPPPTHTTSTTTQPEEENVTTSTASPTTTGATASESPQTTQGAGRGLEGPVLAVLLVIVALVIAMMARLRS